MLKQVCAVGSWSVSGPLRWTCTREIKGINLVTIASDYPIRAYENDEVRVETNMKICRKNDEEVAVDFSQQNEK